MSKRKSQILTGSYFPSQDMNRMEALQRLSRNTYLRIREVKVNLETIADILGVQDWNQSISADVKVLAMIAEEHEENVALLDEIGDSIKKMSVSSGDTLHKQFADLRVKVKKIGNQFERQSKVSINTSLSPQSSPPTFSPRRPIISGIQETFRSTSLLGGDRTGGPSVLAG